MSKDDLIKELKDENEELKSRLIDLTFELNYNKQDELIEFIREIYSSVKIELNDTTLSKREILFSLKKYIEEFAKDNKINL